MYLFFYKWVWSILRSFSAPESLQSCKLTAASMGALSAALTSGQSELKKVDLSLNSIGLCGVASVCEALQHPACKLQSLM